MDNVHVSTVVVSAIVEREVMARSRYWFRPGGSPAKTRHTRAPSKSRLGGKRYENVYDALKREVLEETGLQVTGFMPNVQTKVYSPSEDDGGFAFSPFCCQQVKGGIPRIAFVFVRTVEDGKPVGSRSRL